jgi:succinate dehydrogenase flavin-adding protein (antitoxin of CptAB toxin-antitoxin module)
MTRMEVEKYLNPVSVASIVVAVGTLGYTLWDGERSNARENDLSFSQFAAKISRLEADYEQLSAVLASKDSELAALQEQMSGTVGNSDELLVQLENRISKLEDNPSLPGSVAVEEIVDLLLRDHLDLLEGPVGPQGPRGETGPVGPPGIAGATSNNSGGQVQITTEFTTEHQKEYLGSAEATLVGCDKDGALVECSIILVENGDENLLYGFYPADSRTALPSAEWVSASSLSANGESEFGRNSFMIELSPGIPTKIVVSFQIQSRDTAGLLALELKSRRGMVSWRNISL